MKNFFMIAALTLMTVQAFAFNGQNSYQRGDQVLVKLKPGSMSYRFHEFLGLPVSQITGTTVLGHNAYISCGQIQNDIMLGVEINDGSIVNYIPFVSKLDQPLIYKTQLSGKNCEEEMAKFLKTNRVELSGVDEE